MYAEIALKKDPNISTYEGLVDLATELATQHKSLDITLNNWDATLKILLEVHKKNLAKHDITIYNPLTLVSKKGEIIFKGGDI